VTTQRPFSLAQDATAERQNPKPSILRNVFFKILLGLEVFS
jgi:hypothetical protein